jgi:hypothetical protein
MTHYVLIDNYTGYVWGEADASDPVEACRIVDTEIGGEARTYEHERIRGSDVSGYFVHEAPSNWTPVDDGQSQREIRRVQTLPIVASVVFKTIAD